jgi:hypothetical protein
LDFGADIVAEEQVKIVALLQGDGAAVAAWGRTELRVRDTGAALWGGGRLNSEFPQFQ